MRIVHTSANWQVRETSCPRIGKSAYCLVHELKNSSNRLQHVETDDRFYNQSPDNWWSSHKLTLSSFNNKKHTLDQSVISFNVQFANWLWIVRLSTNWHVHKKSSNLVTDVLTVSVKLPAITRTKVLCYVHNHLQHSSFEYGSGCHPWEDPRPATPAVALQHPVWMEERAVWRTHAAPLLDSMQYAIFIRIHRSITSYDKAMIG